MVLNACLNLFKVSTGFLNKLPFANENCDAVIKFLECVKGPKIVFEITAIILRLKLELNLVWLGQSYCRF